MKRRWPGPGLLLALALAFVMLSGAITAAGVLAGALIALGAGTLCAPLLPDTRRCRRPLLLVPLAARVLLDIVYANLEVALLVLGPRARLRPGYVWVPLALRDEHAIFLFAGIITLTPGTLSAALSPGRRHLLVHALHVNDAQALVASIKARYEVPLLRVFS